jgi:hypothetical protein
MRKAAGPHCNLIPLGKGRTAVTFWSDTMLAALDASAVLRCEEEVLLV